MMLMATLLLKLLYFASFIAVFNHDCNEIYHTSKKPIGLKPLNHR